MSDLPAQIGRYRVQRLLGEGGMGVLYLASDPVLDRLVALKLLRVDSADLRRRFVREAQSAARIQHPNIVTVYDVGDHDGQLYIAMEYIDGDTLASLIRDGAPFSPIRRLDIVDDIADGLGFAHQRGIVHRDIKPANLMITRSGLVKVLDFGIARVAHAHSGEIDGPTLIGTPAYMAPEVLEGGAADARADIYAIGLVTYELLSGRRAFAGATTADVLELVLAARPTPLVDLVPHLDPDLARIVATAMARQPGDRYQDLQAFRKDLARARRRVMAASADDATIVVGVPVPIAVAPSAPVSASPARPLPSPVTPLDETVFAPAGQSGPATPLPPTAPVPTAPAPAAAVPPPLPVDDGPLPVPLPAVPGGLPSASQRSAGRATVDADILERAHPGLPRPSSPPPVVPVPPPPVASASTPPVGEPGARTTAPLAASRRGLPAAAIIGALVMLLGVTVVAAFLLVRMLGVFPESAPASVDAQDPAPSAIEARVERPASAPDPLPVTPSPDPVPPATPTATEPTPIASPAPQGEAVARVPLPAPRTEGHAARERTRVPEQAAASRSAERVPPRATPPAAREPRVAGRDTSREAAAVDAPVAGGIPARREAPVPPPAPSEEAIELVRGYVAARNTSHAAGIRRVWPAVDDVHIRRVTSAFSAPLTLSACDVSVVDANRALATCRLTQPGTTGAYASGQALTIRRTFAFDLALQRGNWVIVGLRE